MGFAKEVKRMQEKYDYKGCRNCINQIAPLRTCEWQENGGDGHIHLMCPRWEHKEEKHL